MYVQAITLPLYTYRVGDRVPKAREYQKFLTTYSLLWRPIGENLGLKSAVLSLIEAENPMKPRECLRVTLDRWLQLDVNATWSTLELAITNAKRAENDLDPLDASKDNYTNNNMITCFSLYQLLWMYHNAYVVIMYRIRQNFRGGKLSRLE